MVPKAEFPHDLKWWEGTIEFEAIQAFYGDQVAKRSGVPYINHIVEGLTILHKLKAGHEAGRLFCLHPIIQDDTEFVNGISLLSRAKIHPEILMLAVEYRNVANRGLNCYQIDDPNRIYLSPDKRVNDALIADKVQNRKDFLKYHLGTHPKSKELDIYFKNWLRALGVTEKQYEELTEGL